MEWRRSWKLRMKNYLHNLFIITYMRMNISWLMKSNSDNLYLLLFSFFFICYAIVQNIFFFLRFCFCIFLHIFFLLPFCSFFGLVSCLLFILLRISLRCGWVINFFFFFFWMQCLKVINNQVSEILDSLKIILSYLTQNIVFPST